MEERAFGVEHPENEFVEIRKMIAEQEQRARQALLSTSEEFKAWFEKAYQKGLRGLFRNLRQRDCPWQRPFQHFPALERLAAALMPFRRPTGASWAQAQHRQNWVLDQRLRSRSGRQGFAS